MTKYKLLPPNTHPFTVRWIGLMSCPGYGETMDARGAMVYKSLEEARQWLMDAYTSNGTYRVTSWDPEGGEDSSFMPGFTHEGELFLYAVAYGDDLWELATLAVEGQICADKRVYFGPRGAVRTERL